MVEVHLGICNILVSCNVPHMSTVSMAVFFKENNCQDDESQLRDHSVLI